MALTSASLKKQEQLADLKARLAEENAQLEKSETEAARRYLESIKAAIRELIVSISSGFSQVNIAARTKRKVRPEVLGASSFEIAGGQTTRLRVPLKAAARRFLRRHKKLKVRLTLYELKPTGQRVTRSRLVIIKQPKARKRKRR